MRYKFLRLTIVFCGLLNLCLNGQALIQWDWQSQTGIAYQDIEFKDNFLYAAGNFTDSAVTVGSNTYVNAGGSDIIICKMDTLGNVIWSVHAGSSDNESLKSICVDNNDNVLVIGSMEGSLQVGATSLNALGGSDMLLIKCDSAGTVLFAKNVGTIGNDAGLDITTDYLNDIYAVGRKGLDTMSFASTNNAYPNAILKWSSLGTEIYMYYMQGGYTGYSAWSSTTRIKYSAYDSTIIIGGEYSSGINQSVTYSASHSSNSLLSTTVQATFWGETSLIFLCKTGLNGVAQKLIESGGANRSTLFDVAINPMNGDVYHALRIHSNISQTDYNYWKKCDVLFTSITTLPINLTSSTYPPPSTPGAPMTINYLNNTLYGLLYQVQLNPGVSCTDYYAVSLNLNTGGSEFRNLEYNQVYKSGIGFNGTFCLGSNNTIGKSCQSNCILPSYHLNPAPDSSFCIGQWGYATIGSPACYYVQGGTAPYTFSWSPATALSATNVAQPYVAVQSLTATTIYTLTVIDALNNVLYDTVQITIHPRPVITYTATPALFCAGDTVALNLSGGNYYYPNPYTIGNYLSNPLFVTPTKDTQFQVLGYNSFGCAGSAYVILNTFKMTAHTTTPIVCQDTNATLIASSAMSYAWQPGSITGDSVSVPVSASTVFTVTGTDASGCTATATTSVLVSSLVWAYPDSISICPNDSIQLIASGGGYISGPQNLPSGYCLPLATSQGGWEGAINNFTFHDLVNNGSGIQLNSYGDFTSLPCTTVRTGNSYPFQIERLNPLTASAVMYAIWIDYNRNGSFADSNEMVYSAYVNAPNMVTQGFITISSMASLGLTRMRVLCKSQYSSGGYMPCLTFSGYNRGEYEDYTINIISKSALTNFSWSAGTVPGNGSPVTAYPSSSTVYTVTTTDFQNCISTATISIQVNDTTSSNTNITLCSNQLPYTWNGQNLTASGNYSYLTTNSNGCDSTAYLNLTVLPAKTIQVFPNPTHSFFTILFPATYSYTLILTDMNGRKVFEKTTAARSMSETISVEHLAEGVYNLKVIGEEVYNVKVIRYK